MSKKKTHDDYVLELATRCPNIEVIDIYNGAHTPILHYCITHDVFWNTTPSRVLIGNGCNECKREKYHTSRCLTQEDYIKRVFDINSDIEVIGEYIDAKTPILHHCIAHNVYWNAQPQSILRGCGCKECSKIKIGNKLRKTEDRYKEELFKINSNIELVGKYMGSNTPILHKCLIDDYVWLASPSSILQGSGCPLCYGNIKKTTEQYIEELKTINLNIEVLGEYINANTPIEHKCKIDGYQWFASPSSILRGNGCAMCAGNAKKTTEQYINELYVVNPNVKVIGQYINALTPILHKCLIDENEWYITPANILSGEGCPECKNRFLHHKFRKTHEQYVADLSVINPDIEVIGEYINSKTNILHRCKIDGCEWMACPLNVLNGKGCPHCKESLGEKKISKWLKSHDFVYIYQYKFNDCVDKKPLPFDFYIPLLNICIEYDGQQHFEPIDFAGNGETWALSRFEMVQHHDKIKNDYCKNNNISLLRIPYFKNAEEELEKFLFI